MADNPPVIDGPLLRDLRLEAGVGLRYVARMAKLSHSHLYKMERGMFAVTPAMLVAYERATGVPLTSGGVLPPAGDGRVARLSAAAARKNLAGLAAVAYGEPLPGSAVALMERYRSTCQPPQQPDDGDVAILASLAELLDAQQGRTSSLVAELLLRWLARLLDAPEANERMWPVLVSLALRAARGADQQGREVAARTMHLVALRAAVRADDGKLRAAVLVAAAELIDEHGHTREAAQLRGLAGAAAGEAR